MKKILTETYVSLLLSNVISSILGYGYLIFLAETNVSWLLSNVISSILGYGYAKNLQCDLILKF